MLTWYLEVSVVITQRKPLSVKHPHGTKHFCVRIPSDVLPKCISASKIGDEVNKT